MATRSLLVISVLCEVLGLFTLGQNFLLQPLVLGIGSLCACDEIFGLRAELNQVPKGNQRCHIRIQVEVMCVG